MEMIVIACLSLFAHVFYPFLFRAGNDLDCYFEADPSCRSVGRSNLLAIRSSGQGAANLTLQRRPPCLDSQLVVLANYSSVTAR